MAATGAVAIVGGGLGGLSAAIHLRLAKYPVTVFEANAQVGGRASRIVRGGFTFDTGPSLLNYPWVFEELFRAAGRELRDYVELLPVDSAVQFRWPDGETFQLSSDYRALLAECARLEPGSGPGLAAFFRDAAAKYRLSFEKLVSRNEDNAARWLGRLSARELWSTSVWRSLDRELKKFFRSERIRQALGAYGMYLGGSPYDLPGLFSILAYGELAHGLWLPRGGVYGLVSAMERLALELGATIQTGCRVRAIASEGGRVTGVELADGRKQRFDTVVSNVDVPTTAAQLLNGARPVRSRMTPGVTTFYFGVRGKVANIGHHTIFLPRDYRRAFDDLFRRKRIPDDLPFYVSIASETDPQLAPKGDSAVFVLVPTPLLSEMPQANWREIASEIRTKVMARLQRDAIAFGPIAEEEVWTPEDWRDRFGLFDGSAFGAAHTLFQMGPFRSRNYSRDMRGLYYTGASTTPGTGMPMVVLGGRMTAERIVSHAA